MSWRRNFAVLAAIVALLLSACGGDDAPTVGQPTSGSSAATPSTSSAPPSPSSAPSPSSSSSSTTSTTSTPPRAPYAVGQCLGPRPGYAQVPCTQAHYYEIYSVRNDSTSANDPVKRSAWATATCQQDAATFFGSQSYVVSRVAGAVLPATANPNTANQIVCIAYEFRTSLTGLVPNTTSLKGKLAGDGFYNYRVCLKGRASTSDDVQFVACDQPHASEAVGGKLNGKPGQAFPGAPKVQGDAVKYCVPLGQKFLGARRTDVIASQNSGGPGPWSRGQMVTGCFVEVTSGTVTKSLRGIGNKPIASYR